MNNKRRLSPVIISLVLVMILAIVPVFAFTSSAEAVDTVTVKFYADDDANYFYSESVTAGTEITLPEVPELDGYDALGWVTEEVQTTTEEPDYIEAGNDVVVDKDTNFYALYSKTTESSGGGEEGWIKTDINNILPNNVVVIVGTKSDGNSYGMRNDKGTGSAPALVSVTISGNKITDGVIDAIKWNITNTNGTLNIYPNGITSTWLYLTNTNNGLRVGTNVNNEFELDSSNGYLYHPATARWIGIYNTQDWRSYATSVTSNNIKEQTFAFYVYSSGEATSTTTYTTGEITEQYTISFVTPDGYEVDPITAYEETAANLPTIEASAELEDLGYEFAGWTTAPIDGEVEAPPTLYTKYTATADVTFYAVFKTLKEGDSTASKDWTLVTDASTLAADDQIIIAAKDYNYALSTSQGSSDKNRGQIEITKGDNTIEYTDGVQTIILESGNIEGTFAFKIGENSYLSANGTGSNNYLRVVNKVDNYASFTIVIDDGTAEIKGQGGNARNQLLYNNTSKIFSCYGSGQKAVCIYRLGGNSATYGYVTTLPEIEVEEPITAPKISGANLTIGADLSVNYYVALPEAYEFDEIKMVFTFNEKAYEVAEYTTSAGRYVFSFTGIAPQSMADNIKAELYVNNNLVAVKDNYSIKQNAINILADDPDNAVLRTLISDMLAYGAAAQEYRNYNKGNLANAGIEGLTPSETVPGLPDRYATKSTSEDVYFISAGVHFDYANKMYAKFYAKEGTSFEIYINGTEAYWTKINDTTYIVYTDFISATAFDVSAEFVLKVDGVEVQTLTYNVNSYAYSQYEIDDAMGRLALALYRYGVSAKAYKENN